MSTGRSHFLARHITTNLQLLASRFGLGIDSTSGAYSSTGKFSCTVPLQTTANTFSIAWTLFAAASVTDTSVRDQLIRGVWNRANSNATVCPFLDYYNNNDGSTRKFDGAAGPA